MKTINYSPHATKRLVDYNLDVEKVEKIIRKTKSYEDLSQLKPNRVIYIGRVGNDYWTVACAISDVITVVTIRESYSDEIRIHKRSKRRYLK